MARRVKGETPAEGSARSAARSQGFGPRVTLKMLAVDLGLSVTTVSRALQDGVEVNRETIARVKAAAAAHGYRPNLGAQNLRTGRTGAIGLILPFERDGEMNIVVASLVEGVSRRLRQQGYRLTVVPKLPEDDPLDVVRNVVEERAVDGVILTHTTPQDARVRYLLEVGMPFVTFGRTELLSPHPSVDLDHESIGAAAARLLLDAGHAAPILVMPPRQYTYALQFLKGWRAAHAERHLSSPDSHVHGTSMTPDSGRQSAEEIWREERRATGAFVASEEAALGFIAGLRTHGREAGRDFGLVTYGGTALHEFLTPPLSAFYYPNFEVGRLLGDFLIRAIAGEDPATLQRVIEANFVDHGSQSLAGKAAGTT